MPHTNSITGRQDDGGLGDIGHGVKIDFPGKIFKEFKQTLVEQIVKNDFYKVIASKPLPQWQNVNRLKFSNPDRYCNFSLAESFANALPNHKLRFLDHEKGTAIIEPL